MVSCNGKPLQWHKNQVFLSKYCGKTSNMMMQITYYSEIRFKKPLKGVRKSGLLRHRVPEKNCFLSDIWIDIILEVCHSKLIFVSPSI